MYVTVNASDKAVHKLPIGKVISGATQSAYVNDTFLPYALVWHVYMFISKLILKGGTLLFGFYFMRTVGSDIAWM